ncbi:MAG: phosphoribosylanthranilate isomerase [Oscillospiraceae bacterium]|nr:phosphoribosylanthranilate isomerase [Oscillospiraceae bacterium]
MTRIKICGLMRTADAEILNAVRPDFAGMILSPGFRRSVSAETAAAIRQALDPAIPAVGVFVNATFQHITECAEAGIIQYVQLHGDEDNIFLRGLRFSCGLPVIQAFRIRSGDDLRRAAESEADYILLDSGTGTGKSFDHALLDGFPRPYLLAGGLTPENVCDVIRQRHPLGVDVSSGVETDGVKDAEKIRAFVKAIRNAE